MLADTMANADPYAVDIPMSHAWRNFHPHTWHISDAHGWHTKWYPSLFDEYYNAKPAYDAIREELSKHND